MNLNTSIRGAISGARRHPWWTAGICGAAVAASVLAGTTVASARPEPMLAVSASALNAAPAAHVLTEDNGMADQVVHDVKPGATAIPEPFNEDGCDHNYGAPNVCVPWSIPGSTPAAKCAWLASNGFGPQKVYGTNRQHLPENAQGYVCASGS